MTTLRQRLHVWVSAWLIFQIATLSAFVPRDCCAAHKSHNAKTSHAAAKPDQTNHHGMDHGMVHEGAHEAAPKTPLKDCVMNGTCQGPMSALVALLSNQGVPPIDAYTFSPDVVVTTASSTTNEDVRSRLASPDPPPPRA